MHLNRVWQVGLLLMTTSIVVAYPNGAPCERIFDQQPGPPHGLSQTKPSPYGLRVTLGNQKVNTARIYANTEYKVEIYGICNEWTPVRGFLLTSKNVTNSSIIGRFLKDQPNYWQATQYACRDEQLGAITHFLPYDRSNPVAFRWILESDRKNVEFSDVKFEATVVQSKSVYWKNIVWPEPKETLCRCPDQKDSEASCAQYLKQGYCGTSSIREEQCPFTCNLCKESDQNVKSTQSNNHPTNKVVQQVTSTNVTMTVFDNATIVIEEKTNL